MSVAKRVAFSLVAALLAFALGEIGLRAGRWCYARATPELAHTEFTYDAHVGWQNYHALRGQRAIPPRSLGVARILAVGDSTCYGVEVRSTESFAARLEKLLAEAWPQRRVEVLNAGVAGFTSSQVLAYLRGRLAPVEPDLVLTYVGHNDPKTTATGLSDRELAERLSNPLSGLVRMSLFFWNVPHGMIATPLGEHFYGRDPKPDGKARVSREELVANLEAIRALGVERSFAVRFVVPVHRGPSADQIVEEDYAGEVRRVPGAIEVLPGLRASGLAPAVLFVDGTHPSEVGHEHLARIIRDALLADEVKGGAPHGAPYGHAP